MAQIRVTASTHHAPRAYVVQDLGGALQRRPAQRHHTTASRIRFAVQMYGDNEDG
jgi:hypothetical protein